MENKIISINISPDADEEINENAGVMWEHNATSLVFKIDPSYAGDYRYYIEYRSLIGTKIRTEYLDLNIATNTITYDIPATMTCLRGVECYFNIVNIDEDGNTAQVVKPKRFYLQFDYAPDTDNSLEKVNDFSINALLEAIRSGIFQGGSGGIAIVDSKMSDTSSNPVRNKIIKAYVDKIAADASIYIDSQNENTLKLIEKFMVEHFVQKEAEKGLSSNDFTDDYKNKLDSIYTPVKGVDYWTADDQTVIQEDCNRYIATQLADRTQLIPEFANDINECNDTTKLYVLPDGFIYAYMYSTSESPEITVEESSDAGYWNEKDEFISSDGIYAKRTNIIPVTEGDQFSYKGYANYSGNASVVWYDSGMNRISSSQWQDNDNATVFTAPTGARYVRFYSFRYTDSVENVVLEVEWESCQAVTTSYQWTNTGYAFVPADYESEIIDHEERIVRLENKTAESVLKGKTIVYDGDSICFGSSNGGGYAKIIAEQTGGFYINRAHGGASLMTRNDGGHSVVDNISTLPENGDLYCFEGGINDWWSNEKAVLGTFDKTDFDGELDTTTVCGALETIFRYALEHFVGKPVCFVITHKIQGTAYAENPNGDTFEDYRNAMVGICNKYSIPYYDAFNESGLNGWNTVQKNNFFDEADGIHPNEEGYKRYYVPQLISLFEKIMPRG